MKRVLGFIPARGGSKGVKDKNIRSLNGKPLIAYTIEEALKSDIFEDVIVSTDSQKIAQISKQYGANVPFLRPNEFAKDNSPTIDAVIHCIDFIKDVGKEYNEIILLQPTSPLRKARHIKEAYNLFNEKKASFVISMCECEHSPLWANTVGEDLNIDNFIKEEIKNQRRQDLPTYYRINGSIYIAKVYKLLQEKSFFGKDSYAYIMDRRNSVDIDTIYDFKLAEIYLGHE